MDITQECPGCGMEFDWPGVEEGGEIYCCEACSRGEPCDCAQRLQQPELTDVALPGNLRNPSPMQ